MSKKEFFPRNPKKEVTDEISEVTTNNNLKNSEKVVCATLEIKEMVTKWTQNINWGFNHFSIFVEQAGVKTPIKLTECTEGKTNWGKVMYSFKCITGSDKEIEISVVFDREVSELFIVDGEETRGYEIKRNWEPGDFIIPEAIFREKIIKRNGKEIRSWYYDMTMYGYAVSENGETFVVHRGGDWEYENDDIKMRYLSEKGEYFFFVTGGKNKIMTTPSISEILTRVEKKTSELMKFVR